MAQRTEVTLIDDLDASGKTMADETLVFGLDGSTYEIDLSKAHADKLRKALADYVAGGRKMSAARASKNGKGPGRPAQARERSAAVRAWAREAGLQVSDRGRIPAEVEARWMKETGGKI